MNAASALRTVWGEPMAAQEYVREQCPGGRRQMALVAFERRGQLNGPAAAQVNEGLLHRSGQKARLRVGVGGNDVESQHDIGAVELLGWLESRTVDVDGLHHHGGREVRGEGKRQSQRRGDLCTE